MAPDKVCIFINACAVLHNMAIAWKQPMSEDLLSHDITMDEDLNLEESSAVGQLAAKHYRDQFVIHNFS